MAIGHGIDCRHLRLARGRGLLRDPYRPPGPLVCLGHVCILRVAGGPDSTHDRTAGRHAEFDAVNRSITCGWTLVRRLLFWPTPAAAGGAEWCRGVHLDFGAARRDGIAGSISRLTGPPDAPILLRYYLVAALGQDSGFTGIAISQILSTTYRIMG